MKTKENLVETNLLIRLETVFNTCSDIAAAETTKPVRITLSQHEQKTSMNFDQGKIKLNIFTPFRSRSEYSDLFHITFQSSLKTLDVMSELIIIAVSTNNSPWSNA